MHFQAPFLLAFGTAVTATLVTRQESDINRYDVPYRCRSVCKPFLRDVKKFTRYYRPIYAPFSDDTDFTNYICGDQDILYDLQDCYDCTSSTRKYSDSGDINTIYNICSGSDSDDAWYNEEKNN